MGESRFPSPGISWEKGLGDEEEIPARITPG